MTCGGPTREETPSAVIGHELGAFYRVPALAAHAHAAGEVGPVAQHRVEPSNTRKGDGHTRTARVEEPANPGKETISPRIYNTTQHDRTATRGP